MVDTATTSRQQLHLCSLFDPYFTVTLFVVLELCILFVKVQSLLYDSVLYAYTVPSNSVPLYKEGEAIVIIHGQLF